MTNTLPFLRPPPFPGTRVTRLEPWPDGQRASEALLGEAAIAIAQHRVGSTFWGRQVEVPADAIVVADGCRADYFSALHGANYVGPRVILDKSSDPWHALAPARLFLCDRGDERAITARLLEIDVVYADAGEIGDQPTAIDMLRSMDLAEYWRNPFTQTRASLTEIIALLGFWRDLIDRNRDLVAGLGFAAWKRQTVAPLLWKGEDLPFASAPPSGSPSGTLAVWKSRTPAGTLQSIERAGWPVAEVEDGFLRSQGLGAECVPPLSITVDRLGPFFDPAQPSELETILQNADIDAHLIERAGALRARLVQLGLGKYGRSTEQADRYDPAREHVLVVGQVEDDRSVQTGGGGMANLELLRRSREMSDRAFIIYKPHPDVEAGHRKGFVSDRDALHLADHVEREVGISALLRMVDVVHVNTSQAGFEALIHDKRVVTHGVPFYAGWGITTDLGPVPGRRTRRRTVDELIAATLLLYPRYLDPVTGLPCPAEVVVERLCEEGDPPSLLVRARKWQGRLRRLLQSRMG